MKLEVLDLEKFISKGDYMATFYNLATLSYTGGSAVSNTTAGEILDILSASKSSLSDTYSQGQNIVYTVGLVNSGTAPLTGLVLTDDLGAYTVGTSSAVPLTFRTGSLKYYVNGVLQPTPTATVGTSLTISGISIPAGGSAVIVYDTLVNQYAPLSTGSQITNTVTVSGDALLSSVSATETTSVSVLPLLGITKSLSPTTVSGSGQITYTFMIENRGNTAATEDFELQISDTFTPILKNISVSLNGVAWTEGTQYSYDETTGVFTTTSGLITVPAATFVQNETTGEQTVTPGVSVLTITGTI